jgi:hypothetical protein
MKRPTAGKFASDAVLCGASTKLGNRRHKKRAESSAQRHHSNLQNNNHSPRYRGVNLFAADVGCLFCQNAIPKTQKKIKIFENKKEFGLVGRIKALTSIPVVFWRDIAKK